MIRALSIKCLFDLDHKGDVAKQDLNQLLKFKSTFLIVNS
jgi:hypothetical protein